MIKDPSWQSLAIQSPAGSSSAASEGAHIKTLPSLPAGRRAALFQFLSPRIPLYRVRVRLPLARMEIG